MRGVWHAVCAMQRAVCSGVGRGVRASWFVARYAYYVVNASCVMCGACSPGFIGKTKLSEFK